MDEKERERRGKGDQEVFRKLINTSIIKLIAHRRIYGLYSAITTKEIIIYIILHFLLYFLFIFNIRYIHATKLN